MAASNALTSLREAARLVALEGLRIGEIIMNPDDARDITSGLTTDDHDVRASSIFLHWEYNEITIQQNPWMPRGKVWIYPPGIMLTLRCTEHEDCAAHHELGVACLAGRPSVKESEGQ